MGVKLDDAYLRSFLERGVAAGDPDAARTAQDELVTHLHTSETFEVWGRGLANHYGRPDDRQDITQIITEEIIRYVRVMTPETLESIDRVAAHLYFRAKTAVVRWMDSPAVTIASKMSGISRRYRQAMTARGEFIAKHNRKPTDRELVEFINAKVLRSRKDAAKQGAMVSEADVSGFMLQAYSMDHRPGDGDGDGYGTPTQDDSVRGRGELAVTVRRLAEIADQTYPDVAEPTVREVLSVWMEFVLDNEPPTVAAIAAKYGVSRPLARERVRQVDSVLAILRGDGTPPRS